MRVGLCFLLNLLCCVFPSALASPCRCDQRSVPTVRRKAAPHEYSVVPGQVYSPCLSYLIPMNRHSCTEALGKRTDHQFSSGSTDRAELRIRVHSLPPYRWCLQMKSRCAMHQTEGVENASPKSERHTKNLGSAFLPYTLRVNLRLLKHCVLSHDNYLR